VLACKVRDLKFGVFSMGDIMKQVLSTSFMCGIFLGAALLLSTGCTKKQESDDLASAQKCLDQVPPGQPSQADECLALVKDYSSQQANILRCAIIMVSGGLMEDKVVKAYNALKDTTQTNKTASFMAVLSLDNPTVDEGYTKAIEADVYCQSSGVNGLKYISGLVVAGTYMNLTIQNLTGTGIDINNPAAINTAVTSLISQCGGTSPPATCSSDLATLGTTVTNLSGSYCSSSSADDGVCSKIDSAVTSAGSNPAAVGQALFCYLNNKTYSQADGLCH
jgi:hypothetical protein